MPRYRLRNQRDEIVAGPHQARPHRNSLQSFGRFRPQHRQRRYRAAHAYSSSTISSNCTCASPSSRITSSPVACSRSQAAACELSLTGTICDASRPARRAPRASAAAKSPLDEQHVDARPRRARRRVRAGSATLRRVPPCSRARRFDARRFRPQRRRAPRSFRSHWHYRRRK